MHGGMASSGLADQLAGLGLRLLEDLALARIQARYLAGSQDGYRLGEQARLALVEVRG